MMAKFDKVISAIDAKNSLDPSKEKYQSVEYPKELLYSQRMTETLMDFCPNASEALKVAARAQHVCRWKIPRDSYPMDRVGYLRWREDLKKMHAEITEKLLQDAGYDQSFCDRVSFLLKKKLLKKDTETQILEDVICLVFLKYYFQEFSAKHEDEKVVDIVQKTWMKMSEKGHEAALKLAFSDKNKMLINQALS